MVGEIFANSKIDLVWKMGSRNLDRMIVDNQPQPFEIVISPPDGGLSAWLKVFGCFLTAVNTYGVAATFGAYQSYYETDGLTSYSASSISWIGTTQIFLLGLTGIVAGSLYDRGFVRSLIGCGCSLVVFGFFTLSVSREYYQIFLSQAICIGIGRFEFSLWYHRPLADDNTGNGLTYVPAVAIIANNFTTKRPIAIGVAAAGSSVGGVILPIMFRELEPKVGFGWVNRIFGFFILSISVLAFFLLKQDHQHQQHRRYQRHHSSFFDVSALREPPYIFLCIGLFLIELGYWIPPFMIAPYAQAYLHTGADFAFYILAIMNAGSSAGRILPAYLAQIKTVGPVWVLFGGTLSLGVLVLCWIGIHNVSGIIVWSILIGFMSGITVSVPNAVVPRLSTFHRVGARTGMMWCFVSFAALIGAPIAGTLLNEKTNSYRNGQLFSGLSICIGSALLCVPAVHVGRKSND